MNVRCLAPILNVSNIGESFAWFGKLGWTKLWDGGAPPTFGAVGRAHRADGRRLRQRLEGGRKAAARARRIPS